MSPDSTIQVTVPSGPAATGILRAVAAGLAAVSDLGFEAIEDVCMAVEEVALQLIGAGAERLDVSFETSANGLTAELSSDGKMSLNEGSSETAIGREVLAALVDDLQFGETTIRFVKRSVPA